MPQISAARPTAGQPIETAWGDQVHDAVEATPDILHERSAITGNGTAEAQIVVAFGRAYAAVPTVTATMHSFDGNIYIVDIAAVDTVSVTLRAFNRSGANWSSLNSIHWQAAGVFA
jgi:hypothetical protein